MTDTTRRPATPMTITSIDFGAPTLAPAVEPTSIEARPLLIIGGGPAGLTAAIYAARAGLAPLVLAGGAPGGQLMLTSAVENYPGFPDGIDGPDLMAAFRAQAERFGATIVDAQAEHVDFGSRPFRVFSRDREYHADTVIVATGASAIWLELPNEARLRGRGVSACATCDGFFFRNKTVAVVGGGDTALEEALFLTRFARRVHLLVRRDTLRASKILAERARNHPAIEFHFGTQVADVLGEDRVEGLRLRNAADDREWDLPTDGLFVAIGHRPETAVFRDWLALDEDGYLIVTEKTSSNVEGVFVAGDAHDHRYRQAITAAGDGARAALDAERWLESNLNN